MDRRLEMVVLLLALPAFPEELLLADGSSIHVSEVSAEGEIVRARLGEIVLYLRREDLLELPGAGQAADAEAAVREAVAEFAERDPGPIEAWPEARRELLGQPAAREALLRSLTATDLASQVGATRALRALRDAEAVPELSRLAAAAAEPQARSEALRALQPHDAAEAREALEAALADPEPAVRATAVEALSADAERMPTERLIELFEAENAEPPRLALVEALGRRGDEDAGRRLSALLQDPSLAVRQAARASLRKMARRGTEE